MKTSPTLLLVALVFLGTAPGLALTAARTTKSEDTHPPQITWDAASLETDMKTHVLHLKDVLITYGTMTVKADRALATAMDFKDSRWTFEGNVRINAAPRGNLRSDEAVVEFQDNQLKRATATGSPAEFDQKRTDSDQIARGHAATIVYEVAASTIRLSNDAWITDGRDDISSPLIVYDLIQEHVQAFSSHEGSADPNSPTPSGRVRVTLTPKEAPRLDGGETNKAKPADPQPPAAPPPQPTAASPPQTAAAPPAAPPQTAAAPPASTPR
jgi:lipopolysaccharide transport protein LptA